MAKRPLAALAIAVLLAACTADAATADHAFRTPSKAIYCRYTAHPDFLRCDVNFKTRFSHRPAWCHFDWGHAFGLHRKGRGAALCVSDSTFSATAKVIAYGTTRSYGPFKCTSKRTGLRCRNGAGHGFELSRGKQSLF